MSNLLALAKAAKEVSEPKHTSILIYGTAKTGKTTLAATIAMADEIDRIFWFDNENGYETLITMVEEGKLTEEAAAKIIVIPIKDTRASPYAIETMLKVLTSERNPIYLDMKDGKVQKAKPAQGVSQDGSTQYLEFQISKLTGKDVVVTDSLSQLGDSALNAAILGQDHTYKPRLDDYGLSGKWLTDCLGVMQQAAHCNFIAITHEVFLAGEDDRERMYPLCGTSKLSPKIGKYFGTVIYAEKAANKHKAGSGSTYKPSAVTGSRTGLLLEKEAELTLIDYFKPKQFKEAKAAKPKSGSLANRLKKN